MPEHADPFADLPEQDADPVEWDPQQRRFVPRSEPRADADTVAAPRPEAPRDPRTRREPGSRSAPVLRRREPRSVRHRRPDSVAPDRLRAPPPLPPSSPPGVPGASTPRSRAASEARAGAARNAAGGHRGARVRELDPAHLRAAAGPADRRRRLALRGHQVPPDPPGAGRLVARQRRQRHQHPDRRFRHARRRANASTRVPLAATSATIDVAGSTVGHDHGPAPRQWREPRCCRSRVT